MENTYLILLFGEKIFGQFLEGNRKTILQVKYTSYSKTIITLSLYSESKINKLVFNMKDDYLKWRKIILQTIMKNELLHKYRY